MDEIEEVFASALKTDQSMTDIKKMHLQDDFEMDSLEVVEFIMVLEDAFELSIKDDEEEKFSAMCIGEMISFVREKIAEKKGTQK